MNSFRARLRCGAGLIRPEITRAILCLLLAALATCVTVSASDSPQRAFAKSWEGRTVTVKQVLYSLVFNERGRLGNTRRAKREGLVVVTPYDGVYLQFDGRQGRDAVADRDPQRVFDVVTSTYQHEALDVRSFRKVEPLVIARFAPGTDLLVTEARVDNDTVRLSLSGVAGPNGADEPVTSITVKWPVPFSRSLSERPVIENLIHRLVDEKLTP